jgi:hypothetical protein
MTLSGLIKNTFQILIYKHKQKSNLLKEITIDLYI